MNNVNIEEKVTKLGEGRKFEISDLEIDSLQIHHRCSRRDFETCHLRPLKRSFSSRRIFLKKKAQVFA